MTKNQLISHIQFLAEGYSAESLRMLESEEGQLNAIYALHGSAAQHGQLLEKALSDLVLKLEEILKRPSSAADFQIIEKMRHNKTIGQLLKDLEKKTKNLDEWVNDLFKTAREKRNFLIHHYFLERQDKFQTLSGRMEMLEELCSIEKTLKEATDMANGMRTAIIRRLEEGQQKESDRTSTVLASFEVDVPDHSV